MIKGIGVDIADTERFKKVKNKKKFLKQFLTDKEISDAENQTRENHHWATLFTIKEAIFKAFKIGLNLGSYWHNININKDFNVILSGYIREFFKADTKVYISQSCSKRYALSFVLVQE